MVIAKQSTANGIRGYTGDRVASRREIPLHGLLRK